jgi:hypothetical protein
MAECGGALAVGAASQLIRQLCHPDVHTEVMGHPLFDDLELHRADRAEHGGLVAAELRAHDLDDTLVVELLDPAPELLVFAGVRPTGHPKMFGREEGHGREPALSLNPRGPEIIGHFGGSSNRLPG